MNSKTTKLSLGLVVAAGLSASCGSKSSSTSPEPTPAAAPAPASTSTATSTATKTTQAKPAYVPKNVPAAIAPTLPASVGNAKTKLNLTTAETSHGFSELNYQLMTMKDDMNETVLYLMLGDAVYDEALAKCESKLPCTATGLKAKVTQEIVNTIKSLTDSNYDEFALTEETIEGVTVGQEYPIESLTIRADVKFGTQTYAKCLKFGGQEKDTDNTTILTKWTSEICFDTARTKVYVHDVEAGKMPDFEDATKKVTYDSKYTATFNLDNGVFLSKSSMKYGKSKFSNDLMIDSRSDKELTEVKAALSEADKKAFKDKEPLLVVANINGDEPAAGGPYGVKVEGFMDDDGGVVKAAYTLSTVKVTGATISGDLDTDTFYLMIPAGITDAQLKAGAFEVAVGSLLTDSSTGALDFEKDELDYWGPFPVPAGVKLVKVSVDEEGNQVLTATTHAITAVTSTTSLDTDWYEEAFDSKGAVTGSCYLEDEGGTQVCTDSAIVTEALKKLPTGGVKVPGTLSVTFGSTLTGTILAGHDFVLLVGTKDVSAVSPADVASYSDDTLVYGSFKGNPSSIKTAFKDDYRITVYPGSVKDDFTGAKLYVIKYNTTTGAPFFEALTGHTITVAVQE